MKLFNLIGRREKDRPPQEVEKAGGDGMAEVYSGMRVEATTFDGQLLFVAKLLGLRGNQAELHQYSETAIPQGGEEPRRIRIRGYSDHERKAVYMEGVITPMPKNIWRVEELTVSKTGNDRAFFRLSTNLEATATMFSGLKWESGRAKW